MQTAIKVIMLAQEESRRMGHNFVGTEQILLGLIHEGTGVAAKSLKSFGVSLKDARVEVQKIIGKGSGCVAVEIPFTPRAKRVLEYSWDEAKKLDVNYIGTEHLLLGIIREGEGVAARVLENLGVDMKKLKELVIQSLPEQKSGGLIDPDPTPVTRLGSYSLEPDESRAKLSMMTNHFLEYLINMLTPQAQKLAKELEEVLQQREIALRDHEYGRAALLLSKQIELTEKLRLCSDRA